MAKSTDTNKPAKSIFTLTEENRKKLKVASAITGKEMQGIVNEALENWFTEYEKKTKTVIPIK